MTTEQTYDEAPTYCAVHPDRETGLRCNRCDRYMCAQCAVQTPVGYRCRECVRQVDNRFFNATNTDPLIAAGIAAVAGFILGLIGSYIGGGLIFLGIVIGLPTGVYLGNLISKALNKRRGRNNWIFALAGFTIAMFIGAFAGGYMSYPEEYEVLHEQMQFARDNAGSSAELDAIIEDMEYWYGNIPTQTEYAIDQILPSGSGRVNVGFYLFLIIAGYGIYLRMKP